MNATPKLRLASFVLIVAIVLMYFKLMTKNPGWCSSSHFIVLNLLTGFCLSHFHIPVSFKLLFFLPVL